MLIHLSEILDPWTRFAVFLITFFLFFIAYKAYKKSKDRKLYLITLSFAVFTLKWLAYIIDFYFSPGVFMNPAVVGIFDLLILGLMFLALLK